MIYVSSIQQAIDLHLGTSETNFFTPDKRNDAIYRSIVLILQRYDIPQYVKETTISFTNGVAELPSDCLRPLYMKNDQNQEYERLDYEMFTEKRSLSYTIKFDQTTEMESMYIYYPMSVDLTFWYMLAPPQITGDASQKLYFKDWWLDAISMYAVSFLRKNSKDYSGAQIAETEALSLCANAWQNDRSRIGGEEEQRLRSLFEKQPMFSWSWTPFYSSTVEVMTPSLQWYTINSDTQALVGQGYFCDSSDRLIVTLPTSAVVGDVIAVAYQGTGGWKIEQNQGQKIIFGNQETTTGTAGYIESTDVGDNIFIVCQTDTNIWEVTSAVGNLTYV